MAGSSCVDCIGPAVSLMRKRLFDPFRFGYWSRLAVIGILAGGLSGGNLNTRGFGKHPSKVSPLTPQHLNMSWFTEHMGIILAVVGVVFLIGMVFFYIGSVMRFVLYEAVLRDKARIREGFSRWSGQGFEYFLFQLALMIPLAVLAFVLVGLPLLNAIRAGGGAALPGVIAHLLGAVLIVGLLGVVMAVVMVLTKDFVVPQMMFEGVSCVEGWERLWSQIKAEPGSYAGYIGLKAALAIGTGIAFLIVLIIAAILVAIPGGLMIAAGVAAFKIAGVSTAVGVAVGVLAVILVVPAIIYGVGFLGVPIAVFFPAYSIFYFASRYRPLYDELYPPAPPATPSLG